MAFGVNQVKAQFFDLAKLQKETDKFHAKAQAKFGAFVRRRMKSSIKYQDGKERPALLKRIAAERAAVQTAHGPDRAAAVARLRALRRQLALVRTPASDPGSPPFAHKGRSGKSPLRELIFFSRDPATNSVVIGPVAFGQRGAGALERGGGASIRDPRTGLTRRVTIRPRPFAKPAGDAEAAKFGEVLSSLVK